MKKPKIVVLGDIIYDCLVWASRLPRKGETVMGYANGFYPGGKGGNQAAQAAKLGAEVFMIGKVGADASGDFLIRELQKSGVNTKYVFRDEKKASGTCCIHVDSNGDNAIVVVPSANLNITMEEIELARPIIESADIFITQLLLEPEIILTCLKWASDAGVTTIFNPAPAREVSDEFYRYSHFVSPNETEAEYLTGLYRNDYEEGQWNEAIAAYFLERGSKALLMTLGSDGSYYDDGTVKKKFSCFKVDAVDCTGAGDSFNAAFAVGYLQSGSIEKAVTFASAAAAISVQGKGAQSPMPNAEQVETFLRDNSAKE